MQVTGIDVSQDFVDIASYAARDEDLHEALFRQIQYSLSVLVIEVPLGIALALCMPAHGWKSSAVLVVVALNA